MPDVKRLPHFVQLLIKNTPRQCQPHVLNCCEPALATYLMGTTATAIDGSILHLGSGWLSVGIAKMSTGKSSRNEPLRAIKARLKQQDDEARQKMDEWNELARCTKASDLPPRPVIQSHLLGSDCTASAMLMRLKALDTGSLLIDVDELAMLTALQTNATTEGCTPLLLAFNEEHLTVDRSSEAGVSGSVAVRLNVSAQGTPYQAARFFNGGWHTGLISRFSFNTIIEPDLMDDDDFLYGSYKGYTEMIAPYIDTLVAQQGKELAIKVADEHARRMRRETLQLAAEYTSEPLRVLCRRQSIIAQKRAYLYTLLEGGKWNQCLDDYLTWRYQYSLWAIFHTVGEIITREQEAEEGAFTKRTKQDGPTNWLMALPETFTLQQLTDLRKLKGATTDKKAVSKQLSNWRSRSLVTDDPDNPGTYINHKKRPAA